MMLSSKKIVFLTGTRADFGKLKPLMLAIQSHPNYELFIFATVIHLDVNYGLTVNEIYKSGFKKVYEYKNYTSKQVMRSRTNGRGIQCMQSLRVMQLLFMHDRLIVEHELKKRQNHEF